MRLPLIGLCCLTLCTTVSAELADSATFGTPSSALPTYGSLRSGIQFAGESVDGDFSLLLPLHSSLGSGGNLGGTLVFAEPYAQWAERGAAQAGLGFGFRHLISQQKPADAAASHAGFWDEGVYVGANASLDMVDARGGRWWQLGLGAEVGTRYLELRGRYHLPLDDGEKTRIHTVRNYQTTRTASFDGNEFIGQSHVTIDSVFNYLTESLRGWEVDTTLLVPGLDRWMDLRVTGGYASFESPTFDSLAYDTWKVGVELRPVPAVVLSATWLENERIVGDNWLFGVGIEIPLGTGEGFWQGIKNAFKPRRRHLAERLVEPTRRGALPMQLGTGLSSAKSKLHYDSSLVVILRDGSVVTLSQASGTVTGSYHVASSGATLNISNSASASSDTASSSASSGGLIFSSASSMITNSSVTFSGSTEINSGLQTGTPVTGDTGTVPLTSGGSSTTTGSGGTLTLIGAPASDSGQSLGGALVTGAGSLGGTIQLIGGNTSIGGTLTMIGGGIIGVTGGIISNPSITISNPSFTFGTGTQFPANTTIHLGGDANSPGTLILVGPQGQQVFGGADASITYSNAYQQLQSLGFTVPP